jgi:hypothetical protein
VDQQGEARSPTPALVTRLEADTAAIGAALLAAGGAGLRSQAKSAVGAQVRHEPAVHDWRSR